MYRKAMSTHMDTGAALAEDDARQVTGLGQRKRKERFIRTEIRDMGRFGNRGSAFMVSRSQLAAARLNHHQKN
jgi:hypothetical protein